MGTLRAKLLKQSAEIKKIILAPFKEEADKHELDGWILSKKKEISKLELAIEEAKGAEKLDVNKILELTDSLELTKVRLEQGISLKKELFETPVKE